MGLEEEEEEEEQQQQRQWEREEQPTIKVYYIETYLYFLDCLGLA
jgi:hypothetical protein